MMVQNMEFGLWHNHQTDLNNVPAAGNIPADLWGAHFNMSPSVGFGFRAFAAEWNLDCPSGHVCSTNGRSHVWGTYIEPSYRWSLGGPMDSSIGVGFRAGVWNDKADELDDRMFHFIIELNEGFVLPERPTGWFKKKKKERWDFAKETKDQLQKWADAYNAAN